MIKIHIQSPVLFTATGVKCRVAAVKRLHVLHNYADYIFISVEINEPILVTLNSEYHLSRGCWWGGGWGAGMQSRKLHYCL